MINKTPYHHKSSSIQAIVKQCI